MIQQLSVDELQAWREEGRAFTLLDVREAEELAICHIAGAMHIPMRTVPTRQAELPAEQPIVCMCHHGSRSLQVAHYLEQQGRTPVYNLEGGIHAWAQLIDQEMPTY